MGSAPALAQDARPAPTNANGDAAAKPASPLPPGIVIYNPANGHYYQSFGGGITWDKAFQEAAKHSFKGVKGHLATVTSQAEYDYLVNSLFVYDYWIGAYRDPAHLREAPNYGWRWITGEPWGYVNWNDAPDNAKPIPYVASFWTGSMKWSAHVPTDQASGYVVEYPTDASARPTRVLTSQGEIDKFLTTMDNGYRKMTTYQANVEFSFKAFVDTVDAVHANLMMQSNGQFRLEGRGENGKLLAISDGQRLMLALTEPGERMKFVVKPMPSLSDAIKQAFSLLTSSPKPPSIVSLITGDMDRKLFSGKGIVGEYRDKGDSQEQVIDAKLSVKMPGEDPIDGNTHLIVDLNRMVYTESGLDFRFKAYPYSVYEKHTDIKINEPIAGNNFVLVITTNAEQVDDLGEGDDQELTFSVPATKK